MSVREVRGRRQTVELWICPKLMMARNANYVFQTQSRLIPLDLEWNIAISATLYISSLLRAHIYTRWIPTSGFQHHAGRDHTCMVTANSERHG